MDTHVLTSKGIAGNPGSLQEWIRCQAAAGQRNARLDLGELIVPSSDLLVLLTLAVREASEAGISLVATRVRPRVRSALLGLGLDPVLEIEDAARGG